MSLASAALTQSRRTEISQYQARRLGLPAPVKDALKVATSAIITGAIDCLIGAWSDKLRSIRQFKYTSAEQLAPRVKDVLKVLILKEMDKIINGLRLYRKNLILRRRLGLFGQRTPKMIKSLPHCISAKCIKKRAEDANRAVLYGEVKKNVQKNAGGVKKTAGNVAGGVKKSAADAKKSAETTGKVAVKVAGGIIPRRRMNFSDNWKPQPQDWVRPRQIIFSRRRKLKFSDFMQKVPENTGKVAVKVAGGVRKGPMTVEELAKRLEGLTGGALSRALGDVGCPVMARVVHHGLDIKLKSLNFPPLPECLHDAILVGCKKGVELAFKRQRILRRLATFKRELEQF